MPALGKPFNIYESSVRTYSTSLAPESIKNKGSNFYEWFGGFTDAEGTFYFKKQNNLHYVFIYQITLHVDDVDVLTLIKDTLGLGKITISKSVCAYTINKQEEIKEIIKIFTKYPLNSTKRLNFLAFKEAFELYINSKAKNTNLEGLELIQRLEFIKSGMNSKRSDFQLSEEHIYLITPNWLLGFIEGEGSFYIITKDFQLALDIGQSAVDSALMVAIQDFFNKLPGENLSKFKDVNLVSLNQKKQQKENHRYTYKLSIANTAYIRNVLIPFFDSLTWYSKKQKDYQDWVTILKLKDMGLQYKDEGVSLIKLINSQMNSRRLSTAGKLVVDRALLDAEIKRMLQGPSNYKTIEGRTWIISKNRYLVTGVPQIIQLIDSEGNILNTFDSQTACAKFLNTNQSVVSNRLWKNRSFTFDEKLCYLKTIDKTT